MPTAYIGMGANLPSPAGPPAATLAAAAERMAALGTISARSHLYSTEPVGITEQPRFVNAVVALETDLAPRQLLDALHAIERAFGRNRPAEIRYGPRTLDLDILLLGETVVQEQDLEIPHPRLFERSFTLVPLNEIAPSFRDPHSGLSVTEWVQRLCTVPHHDDSAIIPIESDLWRPGVEHDAGRSGAS
ncbi:MAG: 2-amino-4-hydroxy-6-hydroxymethyldihydropteridine diphosphokinase [Acidobacteriota bacterium]